MTTRIIVTLLLPVWYLSSFPGFNLQPKISATANSEQTVIQNFEEVFQEQIDNGDLIRPIGDSAYDTYQTVLEEFPTDEATHRKLKRSLTAALVSTSDEALTAYFDLGGSFILSINQESAIDQYYSIAAQLVGDDHFLYSGLMAKAYFIDALHARYIENTDLNTVNSLLHESLSLDPYASYTYNEIGQTYFELGDYQEACKHFKIAIQWNPNWNSAKENLRIAEAALHKK